MLGEGTAIRESSETPQLVGKGVYTLPEAARLLRVPVADLRRWVLGYRSGGRLYRPVLVQPEIYRFDNTCVLTFLTLVEALFVKLFHSEGVSLPVIRRAAQRAARVFGQPHPFALEKLHTDGRRIYAELTQEAPDPQVSSPRRWMEELDKGQLVFEVLASQWFRQLAYDSEGVARVFRPQPDNEKVLLDPTRSFGRPLVEPEKVPTWPLYAMVKGGTPEDEVAEWFCVSPESVRAAVEFESWLDQRAA